MNTTLQDRLRFRMAELGTNATQTALAAGLGKTAVRDILAGKSKRPSLDTIAKIASVLDCSVGYLLGSDLDPSQIQNRPLVDFQEVPRSGILESRTFTLHPRMDNSIFYPVYDHPNFPGYKLSAYLMGDNSMAAIGIRRFDIVTVAVPYQNSDFELKPGMLLACSYTEEEKYGGMTEYSLRQVLIDHYGKTILRTRPTDDTDADSDVIESASAFGGMNLYLVRKGDVAGLMRVLGIAIRITRDFPPMDTSILFP